MFELEVLPNIPLKEILSAIGDSVSGRWLQLVADCQIQYDPQSMSVCVHREQKIITVPTHRSFEETAVYVVMGLRRYTQPRLNPLDYNVDDAVLVNRVIEFDAKSFAVKVAYELHRSGRSSMLTWVYRNWVQGPVRAYELVGMSDFRVLNSGKAHAECFKGLFNNTYAPDKRLINHMLHSSKYMGLGTKSTVTLSELLPYGALPNGVNYLPRDITDLKYSVVDNKSNANFFWFIKFELSFNEKEREMEDQKPKCLVVPFRKKQ